MIVLLLDIKRSYRISLRGFLKRSKCVAIGVGDYEMGSISQMNCPTCCWFCWWLSMDTTGCGWGGGGTTGGWEADGSTGDPEGITKAGGVVGGVRWRPSKRLLGKGAGGANGIPLIVESMTGGCWGVYIGGGCVGGWVAPFVATSLYCYRKKGN